MNNLIKVVEDGDDEEIFKASKELLKDGVEERVKKVHFVAMLNLQKYDDAVEFAKKEKLGEFNLSYALYRGGRNDEALAALGKEQSADGMHLRAQIYYRLGKFDDCWKIYESFVKKFPDQVDEEVFANYSAAAHLAGKNDKSIELTKASSEQTYELVYNSACAAIGKKDYTMAQKYLNHAAALCRETLEEEDYSEEEILDELANILIQTAYVNQLIGNKDEARAMYQNIIDQKPSDKVSLAVAGNNLVSLLEGHVNIIDVEKKMKLATNPKAVGKLTTWQQRGITLNQTLLLLRKNKIEECRLLAKQVQKEYPESDVPAMVYASIAYTEKKFDEAIEILKTFIQKSTDTIRAELSLAQLYISRGKSEEAIKILESCSLCHQPAVVGSIVALKIRNQQEENCVSTFSNAVEHWKSQVRSDPSAEKKLISILQAQAEHFLSRNQVDEAVKVYRSMIEFDPENKIYMASFIHALSNFDIVQAEKYSKQLPQIDVSGINIEKLERDAMTSTQFITAQSKFQESLKNPQHKKKKKKKKNPKPKNYDPNRVPDPERWLPKHLRSSHQSSNRAHQGTEKNLVIDERKDRLKGKATRRKV